ncbi:Amino-acid transporter [Venturia inaequalis]|uniref:Calponin-homology (CH) domain-containing protein n=1 Tax=Venturia inaequalis TaxID=5025 RepID=A0A8H3VFD7_VENIN|nr:hypothetical protein EG327_004075 [Venturia inaequalis]RDI89161.1 Amino-acid transporter [Venturia inaequalis]
MASVSSLDQDMRKLRADRYTPKAANEIRDWIEETLGEQLPPGDLLETLKDGTILCRLANLALPGSQIRFKKSGMPFMQMENISHFLRACEAHPLKLPAHDRFLTVDLFEAKDPAQVVQCLHAFSRQANILFPKKFKTTIGPSKRAGAMSPVTTGSNGGGGYGGFGRTRGESSVSSGLGHSASSALPSRTRALSPALTGGSSSSRATDGGTKSPQGPTSSWSKKSDEGNTAPAWNIHQYGYMGGASQGNQGISFGGRRQITSASPMVPSLAEKERRRREKEQEEDRLRQQAEEAEYKRKMEQELEEERARAAEERQWEEESRRQREEDKRRVDQQKREWEEQERKWKMEEEARLQEERDVEDRVAKETQRKRAGSDARLKGQFLSQYQAEAKSKSRQSSYNDPVRNAERERVQELERQLEEAKERERQYQLEREERLQHRNQSKSDRNKSKGRSRSRSKPRPQPRPPSPDQSDVSWAGDEREYLRNQWSEQSKRPLPVPVAQASSRPLPEPASTATPSLPARPLPDPMAAPSLPARPLPEPSAAVSPRPLPVPSKFTTAPTPSTRTDRFLASNPAPPPTAPRTFQPAEMGMTSESERQAEDARRVASQQKTKAGGWASKSLLEREMERERERQKEWEESQKEVKKAPRDPNAGTGPGASWDVNQYGYAGGDNQGRGSGPGTGIAFGGRRQIIGPRPLGGPR